MSHWVKKAKSTHDERTANKVENPPGVKVIRNKPKSTGETIMEIADAIWPSLMKLFEGTRDENGMLVQPARVRGIALNVAQGLVKDTTN